VSELAGVNRVQSTSFFEELMGSGRLQLGQRLHQAYQQNARQRHPAYQAERYVRLETERQSLRVVVSGRIDGVYRDETGCWVVEELKSWLSPEPELPLLPSAVMEAYRWQCALYMHLLRVGTGGEAEPHPAPPPGSLRGEIVLMDALDGSVTRVPVDYEPARCEEFLESRLAEVTTELLADRERRDARMEHGSRVDFPFEGFRPFQRELCENVRGAADSGVALALSAPTGIGKTAAALQPMLEWCLQNEHRLMFVTAKVSQQELALDTLDRLLTKDCGVTAVQMEAKERSCPEEEILCVPSSCKRLRDSSFRMASSELPFRLLGGGVIRAEDVRREAERTHLCPFELSLACAYGAEVVVGDLNYGFHPGSRLKRLATMDLCSRRARPWCMIIDEAHNLYWRALDFLSPAIDRSSLLALIDGCANAPNPIYRDFLEHLLSVDDLLMDHVREIDEGVRAGQAEAVVDLSPRQWSDIRMRLEIWLLDYLAYIKSGARRPLPFVPRRVEGSRRVIDPAINFCMELFSFVDGAEERGEHMAPVLHRSAQTEDLKLQIHCLDPSRYLGRLLASYKAVVAMSATLEPLSFYVDVLGFGHRQHASCAFPSPFPEENRTLTADVSVSTRYQQRVAHLASVAQKLVELAEVRRGNHLAFFPSYQYQQKIAPLLAVEIKRQRADVELLVVGPGEPADGVVDTLRSRAERFERHPAHPGEEAASIGSLLVCTVMGGVLSEGVDFPGEMAVSAAVIGPGLPPVSFERQLMLEYRQRQDGRGFEHAYLYPGLTRVVQAAGRVIRSESDTGVIMLLGERFREARYRELLPGYWQSELRVSEDALPAARNFWRELGQTKQR
jgi:DNA excision repair protein ERCC-2